MLGSVSGGTNGVGPEKTVEFQGKQVKARSIDFESKGENWNQYTLEDGTVLKMKVVLLDVMRLDTYNDAGDPVYQFSAQQITAVQAPDNLKRKAQ